MTHPGGPMSKKKQVREAFRDACYRRGGDRCGPWRVPSPPQRAEDELDAHHITDREEMPNGGYVPENGISLCAGCHALAEHFHATGAATPGYAPKDLYARIGSDHERAVRASEALT